MTTKLVCVLAGLGIGTVGCVGEGPTIGSDTQEIVGGTLNTGDEAVVALLLGKGEDVQGLCSGTLIAPKVVVTAAHCLDGDPEWIAVYFGTDITTDTDPHEKGVRWAVQATQEPGWNSESLANDIALLRLDADGPVPPVAHNVAPLTDAHVGQPVRLVGFGDTAGKGLGDGGQKRQTTVTLAEYDATKIAYATAGKNTCSGDSGGPAFMTIGGREVLVGVTSFGDEDCEVYGVNTRVDAFDLGFVSPFMAAPTPTPPSP